MKVMLVAVAIGCADSSPPLDHAALGPLAYSVPAGWSSKDLSTRNAAMIEWTPRDNERKESITIIRADRPSVAQRGSGLGTLLREATARLPQNQFGAPARSKARLPAAQIEGEFVPPGQSVPYRRLHAVLADGTHLVHVVYTGRELDRDVFEAVVESIHLD